MINKNFYIKNHIHSKHLNNKIGKKLNVKIMKKNPGEYLVYGKGLGSLNCKKKLF